MLAAVAATGFTLAVAVETEIDPSLRGASRPRRVQWNGDSNQKVVPQCVTGDLVFTTYIDIYIYIDMDTLGCVFIIYIYMYL